MLSNLNVAEADIVSELFQFSYNFCLLLNWGIRGIRITFRCAKQAELIFN